jgi:uncharacterized membrane protein
MAFCANCGAQADGKFCPKCGSALAADAGGTGGGAGGYVPPPPAAPVYATPVQSSGMTDNLAAALCYLLGLLTGILFLVLEPYNKNKTIRFHAFQSIFLNVAWIVLSIVLSIVFAIFIRIPVLGPLVGLALWPLFGLGFLGLWLFLMYKAYNNEKFVLPIIGPLAEKQA